MSNLEPNPSPQTPNRSKLKTAVVAVLVAATLVAGVLGSKRAAQHHVDGTPHLLDRCFLLDKEGMGITFTQVIESQPDQNGKTELGYAMLILAGPLQMVRPISVRSANEDMRDMLSDGTAREVNCENGEPISQ